MASIRKRGAKWQVQVRRKGYPLFTRTFHERADALKWALCTESDLDKGLHPHSEASNELKTVWDLIRRYRDTVTIKKRGQEAERCRLNAMLRDSLAEWPLKSITPAPFGDYRDRRLKEVAPESVRKKLQLLQHAFATALREWAVSLPQNPLVSVRKPLPGKPRNRRLAPGDIDRLVSALRTCRNSAVRPLLLFAIETGMRLGELLSLRWKDVDLTARLAHLRETKNGWPRTVPLSTRAVLILRSTEGGRSAPPPEAPLFDTTPSAVKQAWKRLVRRAGLTDLHFHDLRHEAISRLFERA